MNRALRFLMGQRPTPWPVLGSPRTVVDESGPPLAVVVICYEMQQQMTNTLKSLVPPYQQGIDAGEYEVRVMDNGSSAPMAESLWNLSPNIKYQYSPAAAASKNPGVAINRAVAQTRSRMLCIMIDGARMLSPGVLHWGKKLCEISPRTVVEVRSWHLGPKLQIHSITEGYDEQVEAKLLAGIDWQANGYRLFEISVPAASMPGGFLGPANEATCLFMSRRLFDELGGFDERYQEPGGGLVNADFFHRAVQAADLVFTVLGEGTFHQVHGGAATGLSGQHFRDSLRRWRNEYEQLSRPWKPGAGAGTGAYQPLLAGHLPKECRRWLQPRS